MRSYVIIYKNFLGDKVMLKNTRKEFDNVIRDLRINRWFGQFYRKLDIISCNCGIVID